MEPEKASEISERDQLWATLRQLRPAIDVLATGTYSGSDYERQLVQVLAQIVKAELDFRARSGEDPPA
ncbi:MAG: hypothetical protein K2R98_06415 [Gemmataceae bacterium]|nr:hypothetical protein [Gemmataceae bacterium]